MATLLRVVLFLVFFSPSFLVHAKFSKEAFIAKVCNKKWIQTASLQLISLEGKLQTKLADAKNYLLIETNSISVHDVISGKVAGSATSWNYDPISRHVIIPSLTFNSPWDNEIIKAPGKILVLTDAMFLVQVDAFFLYYSLLEDEVKSRADLAGAREGRNPNNGKIARFFRIPLALDVSVTVDQFFPRDYLVTNYWYDRENQKVCFGMFNAGLLIYDLTRDRIEVLNAGNSGIRTPHVASIIKAKDNGLWITGVNRLAKISANDTSVYYINEIRKNGPTAADMNYPFLVGKDVDDKLLLYDFQRIVTIDKLGIASVQQAPDNRPIPLVTHDELLRPIFRNGTMVSVNNDSLHTLPDIARDRSESKIFFTEDPRLFYISNYRYTFVDGKWKSELVPGEQVPFRFNIDAGLLNPPDDHAKFGDDEFIDVAGGKFCVRTPSKTISVYKMFGIFSNDKSDNHFTIRRHTKFISLDEILGKVKLNENVLPLIHPDFHETLGCFEPATRPTKDTYTNRFSNTKGVSIHVDMHAFTISDGRVKQTSEYNFDGTILAADLTNQNLWIVSDKFLYHFELDKKMRLSRSHVYLLNGAQSHPNPYAIKQIGNKLLIFSQSGLATIDVSKLTSEIEL